MNGSEMTTTNTAISNRSSADSDGSGNHTTTAHSRYKITTVGDGMVGKTCLLMTFVTNEFPSEYVPTVFDNYTYELDDEAGRQHTLCLWDTAGQEDFERLRPLSYPDTACFLVCFSIDSRTTYENVKTKWHPELRHYLPRAPVILVGTKSDIRVPNSPKFVSTAEGNKLKRAIGAHAYVECSALKKENLSTVFLQALNAIRKGPKSVNRCSIL